MLKTNFIDALCDLGLSKGVNVSSETVDFYYKKLGHLEGISVALDKAQYFDFKFKGLPQLSELYNLAKKYAPRKDENKTKTHNCDWCQDSGVIYTRDMLDNALRDTSCPCTKQEIGDATELERYFKNEMQWVAYFLRQGYQWPVKEPVFLAEDRKAEIIKQRRYISDGYIGLIREWTKQFAASSGMS